jgi:hypothetical protein
MTEDPQDKEYLDLFKPKTEKPSDSSTFEPVESESARVADKMGPTQPTRTPDGDQKPPDVGYVREGEIETDFKPLHSIASGSGCTLRTIGSIAGAGCLLFLLTAVVVFAFYQVFLRRGGDDDDAKDTPIPTEFVAITPSSGPTRPSPTAGVAESPLVVPLVSSGDVNVPIALPESLIISETLFSVQTVNAPPRAWPDTPTTGDGVNWVYGTVVNYILGLAPTSENQATLSALQVGDSLRLHMSTGLILNFNVSEVTTGAADEGAFFNQVSPGLTLALLTEDPSQRIIVTATFFNDEVGEEMLLPEAATGLVGASVEQGPVRVTVIDAYQVAADEAGLPSDIGYLLIDFRVENIGDQVLDTDHFQTFVSDAAGERYPLTLLAVQFTNYGRPTDPLAPGETVIGSVGYLVPRLGGEAGNQVRWAFNPLPGSDNWVTVPVPYDLPHPTPTPEPPKIGFARVTIDSSDVFIDRNDNLLIVGLEIENISEGSVEVTEEDVSLSSFTGGESVLMSAGPLLPWTIEPNERRRFELQFDLPSGNDALLNVLGYTFSIDNISGE